MALDLDRISVGGVQGGGTVEAPHEVIGGIEVSLAVAVPGPPGVQGEPGNDADVAPLDVRLTALEQGVDRLAYAEIEHEMVPLSGAGAPDQARFSVPPGFGEIVALRDGWGNQYTLWDDPGTLQPGERNAPNLFSPLTLRSPDGQPVMLPVIATTRTATLDRVALLERVEENLAGNVRDHATRLTAVETTKADKSELDVADLALWFENQLL
ncbi:hypothetical protein [Deinococcus hopiensis]|uniref:Uncharacterized protein n=1 Tax=Deinococcus hopiensis KR-140 TaxID=695939 RepID=A0A1W1UXI4_9DEIO|nr:hypothetical protein [Deinococcus hopiensis]SMB85759.1 hypothetical protein SAMN00790413_03528 [Deinococcus hopiensis KR-140]